MWLPGLGKLKRTFFFYTREQWDTQLPESPDTKQMPTAAERRGDFSQTTQANGQPFYIRDPLRPDTPAVTTAAAWLKPERTACLADSPCI